MSGIELVAAFLAGVVVLTGDQVAALNGAVFAVLGLIAASDGLAVAKGRAAGARIAARRRGRDPHL